MKKAIKGLAPIFCVALMHGCGGGGGGKPAVTQAPQPANGPRVRALDLANYRNVLHISIGTTSSAFSFVKIGGDASAWARRSTA